MNIRFDFGNRLTPAGTWSQEEWERLRPIVKQARKADVIEVKTLHQECGEADAFWTRESGVPLGINTADCVPLLFYREDQAAIGAVHAGWEGTLLRIIPKFFQALPNDLNLPNEWSVKIGPSIRACCYEFGEDLLEKFREEFSGLDPKLMIPTPRHLDLIAILKYELELLRVKVDSIDSQCTYCTLDADNALRFLSFRRGDRKNRQYSIIMK